MKLISVNVSKPKEIAARGRSVTTGIFKEPVAGRVRLGRLNLEGDGQADLRVHGGPDKAVYAYPFEHYDYWERELGRSDLAYGQFGENLTVEGMLEDVVHIGDVFKVGSALLQITQPRSPCYKLGIRMGSSGFPKRFMASGRPGFYLRVLEEGDMGAGDPIELARADPERLSVLEASRLFS